MNLRRRIGTGICILAVSALALSSCANSERAATRTTRSAHASASASASAAAAAASASATSSNSSNSNTPVAFSSAYIRAADEGSDMTPIFGTLKNTTDQDITITGFSSSADADGFELHEVVDGQMRQKEGGFVIPANGTLKLEPGHEHFMLTGLKTPIKAGEKVSVKAELSDGTTIDLGEIPGRQVAAGAEDYAGDGAENNGQGSGIAGDTKSGDAKNDAQGSSKGGIKTPGSGSNKDGDAKSGDSKAGAAGAGAGAGAAAGQGDAKAGDAAKGDDAKGGSKHGGKHADQGAGGAHGGADSGAGAGAEQSAGIRG